MNNKLRFLIKCIIASLPIMIYFLYATMFPMSFLDVEYPMWKQQKDYVNKINTDDNEILILGDSRAKAGILSKQISDNSYNLSVGGASPIEMYYSLKIYLENNPAPKTIIIAFSPMHYNNDDCFWTRTVYFHYLQFKDLKETISTAVKLRDKQLLGKNWFSDLAEYYLCSPTVYINAIMNGFFQKRDITNPAVYKEVTLNKGQHFFGTKFSSDGMNLDTLFSSFKASELMTEYMNKLIELCISKGISVIVEQMPMNETSFKALENSFLPEYGAYMNVYAKKYPEIIVNTNVKCYPNTYFGDNDHMNIKGSVYYSTYLKNKYFSKN